MAIEELEKVKSLVEFSLTITLFAVTIDYIIRNGLRETPIPQFFEQLYAFTVPLYIFLYIYSNMWELEFNSPEGKNILIKARNILNFNLFLIAVVLFILISPDPILGYFFPVPILIICILGNVIFPIWLNLDILFFRYFRGLERFHKIGNFLFYSRTKINRFTPAYFVINKK
ncbi:hypothetical protein HYV81_04755 [Candidatus Woesearchaeota archaeon]|nr:hypothetical protein [Candidatus Woesearchaeota archaeon]